MVLRSNPNSLALGNYDAATIARLGKLISFKYQNELQQPARPTVHITLDKPKLDNFNEMELPVSDDLIMNSEEEYEIDDRL